MDFQDKTGTQSTSLPKKADGSVFITMKWYSFRVPSTEIKLFQNIFNSSDLTDIKMKSCLPKLICFEV